VRLSDLLDRERLRPEERFLVFIVPTNCYVRWSIGSTASAAEMTAHGEDDGYEWHAGI
jgi:hypothetical protein